MAFRRHPKLHIGISSIKTKDFWRAFAAEFIGMVLFLLIITSTVATSCKDDASPSSGIIKTSMAIGFAITILIMAFNHVSGAHLNPAVTFGMMIIGKISLVPGLLYILAQCAGAIIGSGLTYGLTTEDIRCSCAVPKIEKSLSIGQGFGAEFLFTFILVFVIFSMIDEKKNLDMPGCALGVGYTVTVTHLAGIPLTSCAINPARALGPAVVMGDFKDHWVYWLAPLLGGLVAALAYKYIFYVPKEEEEEEEGKAHEENGLLEVEIDERQSLKGEAV